MAELKLKKKYASIRNCRLCGFSSLNEILFFGRQPLANSLKKRPCADEPKYPLTLLFCRRCCLVQLKETVKKEVLFDRYIWVSGTSRTARTYADNFYKRVIDTTRVSAGQLVVEIASNDGTFLKPFLNAGYAVLGVEPAKNIANIANKIGIKTINRYWDNKTSGQISRVYGKAKIIIARNVLPHASGIHDVIRGIYKGMADDGFGIAEFHYAGTIHRQLQYDSVYHEHLCYFSIKTMEKLLNMHGLFGFHIDSSPISGGSYAVYFSKVKKEKSSEYKRLSRQEDKILINNFSAWKKFAGDCMRHRDASKKILNSFKGRRIIGFGSSARSCTYLNFCAFSSAWIKAIIDNNRFKQRLYSPGASIPIVSCEEGFKLKPEILFILAWNFKDEIMGVCRDMGYKGEYLIPFPNRPYITS